MTALPDQSDVVLKAQFAQSSPIFVRPNVRDHFWGYEVSRSVHVIDLAGLARGAAILFTISAFIAACLVWLVPAMAFAGDAIFAKTLASFVFICLGVVLIRIAGRSTRVRVQIDTSTGEVREVVSGMFGTTIVLSRYGLDTVKGVSVVTSRTDPTFGQIHLSMKYGDTIPVGDGVIMALRPLRDRLAGDCGFDVRESPRVAIWGGPVMGSSAA